MKRIFVVLLYKRKYLYTSFDGCVERLKLTNIIPWTSVRGTSILKKGYSDLKALALCIASDVLVWNL